MSLDKSVILSQTGDSLTAVYIRYRKNRINHRLRFGTPVLETRLGWHSRLASFKSGQIFGYIRWSANEYGTQVWRLFICRAGGTLHHNIGLKDWNTGHHNRLTRIPGVMPGAHILLKTQGATRVKRALKMIDQLETETGDLNLVTQSYWRHLHNRLDINQAPHGFSAFQARMNLEVSVDDGVNENRQPFEMALR